MKNFLKFFSFTGIMMLVLCALTGVVDGSVMMAAAPQPAPGTPEASTQFVNSEGADGNPQSQTANVTSSTEVTNSQNGERIRATIDQTICKIRPTMTPLDTIIRGYAKAKQTKTMFFDWYSTDIRPVKTTVTSYTANAAYNADNRKGGKLVLANPALYQAADTIVVSGIHGVKAGVTDTAEQVLYISAIDTNGDLQVIPINGDVDAQGHITVAAALNTALTAGTEVVVYRMANAHAEGEIKTADYVAYPTKEENYCQIFKFQVSQTTLDKLAEGNSEINWTMSDMEEQGLYEFKMRMESSGLFGVKSHFYDPVKKKHVYTTQGILSSIKKKKTLGTVQNGVRVITNDDLIDLEKYVFQGNCGDKKRILFAGSGFVQALSKVKSVEKQIEAGNTVILWGMEWKEIRSNFGSLMLMQHDMFDLYGWENKAAILDPQFIEKWGVQGMESKDLDTKSNGEFDGDVRVWTEICGYALRYPSCHCIVELA